MKIDYERSNIPVYVTWTFTPRLSLLLRSPRRKTSMGFGCGGSDCKDERAMGDVGREAPLVNMDGDTRLRDEYERVTITIINLCPIGTGDPRSVLSLTRITKKGIDLYGKESV